MLWSWRRSALKISDKLPVQITKSECWNNKKRTVIRNHTCSCSCQKPLLLHNPCSHEIVACLATKNMHWGRYVPKYFLKQTILDTWNHTIEGYLHLGTFTQDLNDSALHIPNPDPTMCQGVGRHKKKRIRNNMDEAEAGPQVQICSKCNNPRHSYKKCTEASYFSTATSPAPLASARGRRSRRYTKQWTHKVCFLWVTAPNSVPSTRVCFLRVTARFSCLGSNGPPSSLLYCLHICEHSSPVSLHNTTSTNEFLYWGWWLWLPRSSTVEPARSRVQ
jgi:hypothetical protein